MPDYGLKNKVALITEQTTLRASEPPLPSLLPEREQNWPLYIKRWRGLLTKVRPTKTEWTDIMLQTQEMHHLWRASSGK